MEGKTIVETRHGSLYGMCGFDQATEKWFQHCCQHGAAPGRKAQECKRISLTFRLTAATAKTIGFAPATKSPLRIESKADFASEYTFDQVYDEIKPFLTPDITKRYGKICTNKGRMSCELVDETHWPKDRAPFVYKYSQVSHSSTYFGPIIATLAAKITSVYKQHLDWVHVTYYPGRDAQLSARADDEACIAYGSDIFALTFIDKPSVTRDIFVEPKKPKIEPEAKKRKTK